MSECKNVRLGQMVSPTILCFYAFCLLECGMYKKRASWGWAVPGSVKAKLASQLTDAVLTSWNEQSRISWTFHRPLVTNHTASDLTSLKSWNSERTAVKEKKCAKRDNGLPRQTMSRTKLCLYAFFPVEIGDTSRLKKNWKNPKIDQDMKKNK